MSLIKTPDEILILVESGRILAESVTKVLSVVESGVTTSDLDDFFVETIRKLGAKPAFLGYKGYTKTICTSVNDQVVHAIPGKVTLADGDIIGVDCGVVFEGMYTDMARTVAVGSITDEARRLIEVTKEALQAGIQQMIVGNTVGDISAAVQAVGDREKLGIVRDLVGHGVGHAVHEEPAVPNYGRAGTGLRLEVGMVLAVEPMFTLGGDDVIFEKDGWTVTTADGTLSAHFEDTIVVTEAGPHIVTKTA
ncbi:MAG: type I methionyl aminopeptidase [Candidatus Kerfeldbacteria bacterium CG15_BIG_FIL_POST_REV_8_21_14_020_45_12]|uniref:Methionine aminopeptidase n=1 Tax=Candidatus Kerfeldbacteria bacterium CG15_BIG_FIL_POST_REV_8_21_14_020_45_12 TaxID=2014247 RepID=A0A2M7H3S0_9BACT|nr:MAG: type I methionyl aminopeptidase [Candidatus Kerfeldbacteria bacterium CG15_BIG_FIL_POST_REV_8_21_14_020_45_12]PJA94005.1 MAG: type I methionyl aminopeptidase [Candidatus Kerfeldbacteria bacterium CG_4_9_14_3_um_filter_45_8]